MQDSQFKQELGENFLNKSAHQFWLLAIRTQHLDGQVPGQLRVLAAVYQSDPAPANFLQLAECGEVRNGRVAVALLARVDVFTAKECRRPALRFGDLVRGW